MRFGRARHKTSAVTSLFVVSVVAIAACADLSRAEETKNPLNSMFGLFGSKTETPESDTIDYRPRAPLVVPPNRDLPEPKEAVRNPAWPKDADAEAQRRAAIDSRRRVPQPHSAKDAQTREAQARDAQAKEAQTQAAEAAKPDEHEGECLLNDTGPQSCFQKPWRMLQATFGGTPDEPVKPGTEPERKLLIEPPSGYRTATAVPPKSAQAKAQEAADKGPFDSFLETFGMKKSSDN
jgi:hypothetical protein